MDYYVVAPEVAGGLGANTVLDRSTHPPLVSRLHYEFDGWLGDELLETFPCFIVSERIRDLILRSGFTGAEFAPVEMSTSSTFGELCPNRVIPAFVWLKLTGAPGIDDFGLSENHRLVVSKRVLLALDLKHCDVDDFDQR